MYMRKFFLFALLCAATAMMAETKVETFDTKDGTKTNTYVTSPTTKECQQASWTVYAGGILTGLGNMGTENFASVTRAKKDADTEYPYMESSVIEGGIDSLWFTWNSNGAEAGNWNIVIYINGDSVGSITEAAGEMIEGDGPFNVWGIGGLGIEGDFTIKVVNKSAHKGAQTKNSKRLVIDNLSWETKPVEGEKTKPEFAFAEKSLLKMVEEEPFVVSLTNGSDDTPVYESSNPDVATVASDGTVSIVGVGYTTISASVNETEIYKAAEASYVIRVVPMNFHLETFDGAQNATGNATYLTNDSVTPVSDAGIVWTTHLGSVRNNLGGGSMPPASNIAAVIRAKKSTEEKYAYLESSVIAGGIDALAFDWTCNGTEASRKNPWNIVIYINGDSVGAIQDACTAIPSSPYRYELNDLKIEGDFSIKIVNLNDADADGNEYRFVMDNLEWYSYDSEDLPTGIENQAVKADVRKMVENGMVVIYRNGVRYNLQGVKF